MTGKRIGAQDGFMSLILHCRDAGFDCDAVVVGESADDVLRQVRPHAAQVHGLVTTPDLEVGLRQLLRTA